MQSLSLSGALRSASKVCAATGRREIPRTRPGRAMKARARGRSFKYLETTINTKQAIDARLSQTPHQSIESAHRSPHRFTSPLSCPATEMTRIPVITGKPPIAARWAFMTSPLPDFAESYGQLHHDALSGARQTEGRTKVPASIQRNWPHPDIEADMARLRERAPLVHCLTNFVAAGFTANVLLAVGASPAMVIAQQEAADFAARADAVVINLGTITAASAGAMEQAASAAAGAGTPWVLDPVAVGVLAFRSGVAAALLRDRPAVIRGNASEILALAGADGGGKGVDSTAASSAAVDAARALAGRIGAVVAVSGATDYVTNGTALIEIAGGHPIMTRVVGTGCALGALIAAFLGADVPPQRAATAASAVFAHAAERAAAQSRGPGSFAAAFLDELSCIGNAAG